MSLTPHFLLLAVSMFVLTGAHCFFVLAAVSLKRTRSAKLRQMCRGKRSSISHTRLVLIKAEEHLVTAQVGIFLSTLLLGFCIVEVLNSTTMLILGEFLPLEGQMARWGVALVLFVLFSFFLLLLGQIAKSLAYSHPETVLCLLSRPLLTVARILKPLVGSVTGVASALLEVLKLRKPIGRDVPVSMQEISDMVDLSSEAGEIEEQERRMIQSVFTFSDTLVREVMTPRSDLITVSETVALPELLSVFARERVSRIPVTGLNLDEIKGVLHARDLIQWTGKEQTGFDLKALMRKPYFIPNNKRTADALTEMRREGVHLAIVLDEHGGVDGVVTVEDLVEEIVGEIRDEYDSPTEEAGVQRTRSGDLLVDGGVLIDDLNTRHKFEFPKGEYDTLAGLVSNIAGRIPDEGELLEAGGERLKVEEVSQNRIVKIRVFSQKKLSNFKGLGPNALEAGKEPAREITPASRTARISNLG